MSFVLSCCSTADMPKSYFQERDIQYVCFHYQLDDKDLPDDLGESMPFADFYQAMRDGANTRTSQVSVGEYEEFFEPFLRAGQDILHITLSSGISGTLQSALAAQKILQGKYPNRKLIVVDSLNASAGYGLMMDVLADMRDEGKDIEEVASWIEENKLRFNAWFFTSDLTFLIRGGRVSKTAGFFGKMLNICPLLNINFEGKLIARDKVRTKRKVMQAIVDKMEELADGGKDYTGKVFISNSDCYEDAQAVADLLKARFPKMAAVKISDIGTTIGSHTGPGTVAVFFIGAKRVD